MSGTPVNRLKLSILGGFLGSGKTTWLRHQLHHGRIADALVIVNEAAEAPVDGAILSRAGHVVMLAGGCACCTGRAGFIALLRDIANERTRAGGGVPGHVVIETSGLADPSALIEAVRGDPVLIHHVHVAEIVVVVDGVNGLSQLRNEPLSRAQVEAADRLIVTKIDEAEAKVLLRLTSALAAMNPGARRTGSIMGDPAPLAEPDTTLGAPEEVGEPDGRPIIAASLDLGPEPNWTDFAVWLSALLHARGNEIVRVKGVVRTASGRLLLQSVRCAVQVPEVLPDDDGPFHDDNRIAIIGRGFAPEDLPRSLRAFTAERQPLSLFTCS
jgi:G3E family GTPase